MSNKKKEIRKAFRDACFERDKFSCVVCAFRSTPEKAKDELDAHHITDRNLMPNGGYVKENGISLCATCHEKAEIFHSTGIALPNFSPQDLYEKIGSTLALALSASENLR